MSNPFFVAFLLWMCMSMFSPLAAKSLVVEPLPAVDFSDPRQALAASHAATDLGNGMAGRVFRGDSRLVLLLAAGRPEMMAAFGEVGVTLGMKGARGPRFGVLLPAPVNRRGFAQASATYHAVLEALPESYRLQLLASLKDTLAPGRLFIESPDNFKLPIPGFHYRYHPAEAVAVIEMPLFSMAYPNGLLPISRKNRLEVRLEIGTKQAWHQAPRSGRFGMSVNRSAPLETVGRRREAPVSEPGYHAFSLELQFDSPLPAPHDAAYDVFSLLALLDDWSIRGNGLQARRPMVATPFPLQIHMLIIGEPLRAALVDYIAHILPLTDRRALHAELERHWQADVFFPAVAYLLTNMHERDLQLSSWEIFLQDDDGNQYEQRASRELDKARPTPPATKDAVPRGFTLQSRRYLLFFQRFGYDQELLLGSAGKSLRLVFISRRNADERLEIKWKIPATD